LLQRQLNNDSHSDVFRAFVGFKHAAPSIEDAVNVMAAEGIRDVLAIVMSPFVTDYGPKPYMKRAREAVAQAGVSRLIEVAEWGEHPKFIGHWAQVVRDEISEFPKSEQEQTAVIFSAHSLPQDFPIARNYAIRVQASAKHIAEAAGLPGFAFAWQSAGKRGRSWLGPDIVSVTRDLWQRGGRRSFIYCPIGFVADHLEVLYDNDIECRDLVIGLGGRYLRAPMPNASVSFVGCLADAVGDAWRHSRLQEPEVRP
jgi:ferrochelatase